MYTRTLSHTELLWLLSWYDSRDVGIDRTDAIDNAVQALIDEKLGKEEAVNKEYWKMELDVYLTWYYSAYSLYDRRAKF